MQQRKRRIESATVLGGPGSPALYVQQDKRPQGETRHLIRADYNEADGYYGQYVEGKPRDYVVKIWDFYYSDGDVETVTLREPSPCKQ